VLIKQQIGVLCTGIAGIEFAKPRPPILAARRRLALAWATSFDRRRASTPLKLLLPRVPLRT
jgi:hypothetical protein